MAGWGFLAEPGFWAIIAIVVAVFVGPELWRSLKR